MNNMNKHVNKMSMFHVVTNQYLGLESLGIAKGSAYYRV